MADSGNPFDDPELLEEVRTVALNSDEVFDIVDQAGKDIAAQARALAPKRTGRMASRIRSRTTSGAGGPESVITAPPPANLLATAKGYRWQLRAWGHPVRLMHTAADPFLKRAKAEVLSLYDSIED